MVKSTGELKTTDLERGYSRLEMVNEVWLDLRATASRLLDSTRLATHLTVTILDAQSLANALTTRLATLLNEGTNSSPSLEGIFNEIFADDAGLLRAICSDLIAIRSRDPATTELLSPFLFQKGFLGVTAQRVAHRLWQEGDRVYAQYLQHRISVVCGIDVHPAAHLGHGILIDHATGVVIGETAKVGNNVTMFHGVTLGGRGWEHGERHPKVGNNVFIGASAILLGNITIGDGARIAAGSVVIADVPADTLAVGTAARLQALSNSPWSCRADAQIHASATVYSGALQIPHHNNS